jgi:hypothetical protein
VTSVPASFVYQTTDPATNGLTGSPNTPVSIPAGAAQSFVIALTPNAPVVPTEVALGFDCAGANAARSNTGLNTLLYSASVTPVPDIVALAATAMNDGILHITGTSGSNALCGGDGQCWGERPDHRHRDYRRRHLAARHQPLPDQSDERPMLLVDRLEPHDDDQQQRDADLRDFRDGQRQCAVPAPDQPHLRRVQRCEASRARLDQRRGRNAMMALRQIFRRLREF